jgi:hypothetical protein
MFLGGRREEGRTWEAMETRYPGGNREREVTFD